MCYNLIIEGEALHHPRETMNNAYLSHGCTISYTLEKAGFSFAEFEEFWGSLLIAEKSGDGQIWYDRRQAEAFINN